MTAVVLRADAGPEIGAGHVMRSLALAQGLAEAGRRPIFAVGAGTGAVEARLRAEGVDVAPILAPSGSDEDAEATTRIARDARADWVVIDGYRFGAAYHRAVAAGGLRRLAIDDRGDAAAREADLVVNQNLHAEAQLYGPAPRATLLLGPRYALLRKEFRARSVPPRSVAAIARRLLVTFGGSDPRAMTERVLDAVDRLDPALEVAVVVGASNQRKDAIEERCRRLRQPARVLYDAHDMPALMRWADVAVCSGGSTVWELAFMGLPALVGATAPVEELLVRGLAVRGLFTPIASLPTAPPTVLATAIESLLGDPARRARMSELGRSVVDGQGVPRVVATMGEGRGGHGHS